MGIKYYKPFSLHCSEPKISVSPHSTSIRLNRAAAILWRGKTANAGQIQFGYDEGTKRVYIKPVKSGLSVKPLHGHSKGSMSITIEGFFRTVVKRYPKEPIQVPAKMVKGSMVFSLQGIV